MNIFFDRTLADGIAKYEALLCLIDRIEENPDFVETLSYEQLLQVEAYYDEKIEEVKNENNRLREYIYKLKNASN